MSKLKSQIGNKKHSEKLRKSLKIYLKIRNFSIFLKLFELRVLHIEFKIKSSK